MAESQRSLGWLVPISLVALALLGWWWLGGPDSGDSEVMPGAGSTSSALDQTAESLASDGTLSGDLEAADLAQREALTGVLAENSGGRRVSGRVLAQGNLALEGDLRVYAFPMDLESGEAVRLACDGFLVTLRERELDSPEAQGDPVPIAYALVESVRAEHLVAEAEVDADGRFEIELPADAPTVQYVAAGRTQWSVEPVRQSSSEASELYLPVTTGALLTGKLRSLPEYEGLAVDTFVGGILFVNLDESVALRRGSGSVPTREAVCRVADDMTFELSCLEPDVPLAMRVSAEGPFQDHDELLGRLDPTEHRRLEVDLRMGSQLSGRVIDQSGQPIAEAQVSTRFATRFGPQGRARREAWTDADGRFELLGVSLEDEHILVEAKGYLKLHQDVPAVEPGTVVDDLVLTLDSGGIIRGRVSLPGGAPAPGVQVEADLLINIAAVSNLQNWKSNASITSTDASGGFAIQGLMDSSFTVTAGVVVSDEDDWAAPLGWLPGDILEATAEAKAGTDDLALELKPLGRIFGTVTDPEGNTVPEAIVILKPDSTIPYPTQGDREQDVEVNESTGEYEIRGVREGKWRMKAIAPGYAFTEPISIKVPVDEPTQLILQPEILVSGSVVTPEGLPAQGAVVQLQVSSIDGMLSSEEAWDPPQARTDAEGQFSLQGLPPQDISLVANHQNFAPSVPLPLSLESSSSEEPVQLVLLEGGRIRGVVYGPDGDLAVGERVVAQNQDELISGPQVRVQQTDQEGRFEFKSLAEGNWQVMSFPGANPEDADQGALFANMVLEMVEVKGNDLIEIVLGGTSENPIRVTGRVTSGGEPATSGFVMFMVEGADVGSRELTTISKSGDYELVLNSPGPALVTVQVSNGGDFTKSMTSLEFRREIPESDETRIDFDLGGGRISGRVTDASGAPRSSVSVKWTKGSGRGAGELGGTFAQTQTDENGAYEFGFLSPGIYNLTAGGAAFLGASDAGDKLGRAQQTGVQVGPDELVENIDFSLQPGYSLEGVVRNAAGDPVAGASVFATDESGNILDHISMVRTDGSGRFSMHGLAEGRYALLAQEGANASPWTRTEIRAEATAQPELRLEQGTILIVRVERDGEFGVDANVRVTDEDGRDHTALLSLESINTLLAQGYASGETRVGPVPPGRYRVEATTSDGLESTKTVQLTGKPERRLRLRLRD